MPYNVPTNVWVNMTGAQQQEYAAKYAQGKTPDQMAQAAGYADLEAYSQFLNSPAQMQLYYDRQAKIQSTIFGPTLSNPIVIVSKDQAMKDKILGDQALTDPKIPSYIPANEGDPNIPGTQAWFVKMFGSGYIDPSTGDPNAGSGNAVDNTVDWFGKVGKGVGNFFGGIFETTGSGLMSGFAGPALLVLAGLYLVKQK